MVILANWQETSLITGLQNTSVMFLNLQKFKWVMSVEGLDSSFPFCCFYPNSLPFDFTAFLITVYTSETLQVTVSGLTMLYTRKAARSSVLPLYLPIVWAHIPQMHMFLAAKSMLSLETYRKSAWPHLPSDLWISRCCVLMVTSTSNLSFLWTLDLTQISPPFRRSVSLWCLPRHGIQCLFFAHPQRPYAEKAMAPHSSTFSWKISWTEEPGRLPSMGSIKVRYDWASSLSLFTFMH